MYSPIPFNEVILPRFSSFTLSDTVQLVPAERSSHYFHNIETSVESHEYLVDTGSIQAQSFSLRLGNQATSAFVPISPVRNGPLCVHLHKKSKTRDVLDDEVLSSTADIVSSSDQDDPADTDTHVFPGLQETPYHDDESDHGFFLLAPGLDPCPDLSSTRRERRDDKKRTIISRRRTMSPTLELNCSKTQEQENHSSSFYMPPAIKRRPKISLQPRLKKNTIFF